MTWDALIFSTSTPGVRSAALFDAGARPIVRHIMRSAMSLMAARRRPTNCGKSKLSRRSSAAAKAVLPSGLHDDFYGGSSTPLAAFRDQDVHDMF